jgi:hypothetical protein
MKQYKEKTKLVKKIGTIICPLMSGKWKIGERTYYNGVSGDVTFKNLRIYDAGFGHLTLKVDVIVSGFLIGRKSHLTEEQVIKRMDHNASGFGMTSRLYSTRNYKDADRSTKIKYSKVVKNTLQDYVTSHLKKMVNIDHLLNGKSITMCVIDKIIYE